MSLKYYKNIYKNKVTSYKHVKRKISNLAKQINIKKVKNKNRKTLIISGTHDIKDIYYYCKNRSIKNKNKFYSSSIITKLFESKIANILKYAEKNLSLIFSNFKKLFPLIIFWA